MKIILALSALLLTTPAAATAQVGQAQVGPSQQASLVLSIQTPRPEGRIAIAVYRDADSFRRNRNPVRTLMLDRDGPVTHATITGLAPGRYAIAAFQDLNRDGRLGTNPVGIPNEPFGFSSDARARFGPPSFEAAAFTIEASGASQRIILRNPMNAILH